MIKGGFILQPRKIDESEVSKMPPVTRELWLYLLRKVNHKDNGKFKRGQGFFSLRKIQEALEWHVGYRIERYSKPQLTKSLRRLREGNMIETTKATRGVVVTICNYDIYQDISNYEGNNEGNTKETRRKSSGITKNKNERKKERNIILPEKFKNFGEVVSLFDSRFFNQDKWLDCYDKLIRIDGYTENRILEIVKEFREEGNWWRENGNFESLIKLRQKNKEGIKYIDFFEKKLTPKAKTYEFTENDFS